MSALVLMITVLSGAAAPLEFEARPFDTVKLKNGELFTGRVIPGREAGTVRVQIGRSQRSFPRDQVEKIIPRLTLEEAHDRVAATVLRDDAHSWHGLALECLKKRPPLLSKAAIDLNRAIEAQETHAPSHLLLTRVLLRVGDLDGARGAAEHFRRALPREAGGHVATGEALAALGEDPREAFRAAIEIAPSVEACLGLARAETSRGNVAEAEKVLGSAARLAPDSAEVRTARGNLFLAQGKLASAEAVYEGVLRRAVRVRDRRGGNSARVGLASALYLQGRLDEALKVLLEADPTDTRVTYILGLVRLAREGRGPTAETEKLFDLAAKNGFARARLGLGTVAFFAAGGDFSAALPHFERAAQADRGDAHAALLAAWSKVQLGRAAEAASEYARVTQLAPDFADGHAALAGATLLAGSRADAARLYVTGLERCPESPGLLAGLGLVQLRTGDMAAARASLEQAYRAGFRGPDVFTGLGYLAHTGSDNASAAEWFTLALTAASGDPAAGAATKYVKDSLPRLYGEIGLKPVLFTFDEDGEPADPLDVRARSGPAVVVERGRLVISGKQTGPDGQRTRVILHTDGALFRSAAADFEFDAAGSTTAGLLLESHIGAIEIARLPQAGIGVRFRDGRKAKWQDWRALVEHPFKDRVRLSISMMETGKNLARLELRAAGAPPVHGESPATRVVELRNAFWRERAFSIVLFAAAPKGEAVRAAVDNLVLLEKAQR